MILEATRFADELKLPPEVGRARQILIKPSCNSSQPYPSTTSPDILESLIARISEMGNASIVLLEGNPQGEPMQPIYHSLRYDFPHVVQLDVRDCVLVEVENPLPRPFSLSAFWLPNVVLYCDYLITISPFKVSGRRGSFSLENLLGLLPINKYRGSSESGWGALYSLGIDKVIADLYFTLPIDLGIIDARRKVTAPDASAPQVEDYNKVFVGDPFEVDREASQAVGLDTRYLKLIESAKEHLKTKDC